MATMKACRRCRLSLPAYMVGADSLCMKCRELSREEAVEHPRVVVDAGKFRKLLVAVRREVEWLERTVVGMEAVDGHDEDLVAQMRDRARELRSCMGREKEVADGQNTEA